MTVDRLTMLISVAIIATLFTPCWRASPWPMVGRVIGMRLSPEPPPPRRRLTTC